MSKTKFELIHEYLQLLDEERNHHARTPFPRAKELRAAEEAMRAAVGEAPHKQLRPSWTKWDFVVPPENVVHVQISQRHDIGHFYVSVKDYVGEGKWEHREASSRGGFKDYATAEVVAKQLYDEEVARAGQNKKKRGAR